MATVEEKENSEFQPAEPRLKNYLVSHFAKSEGLDTDTHTKTYTPTHTHTHIYIYMCVCVCVCVTKNRHLAIIKSFQRATPYRKPTSSENHHTIDRKKL